MKVCAIVAHPDDETFCAGTLAKLIKRGHEVTNVIVGCGEKGNPDLSPEDTIKERVGEATEAAKVIGAKLQVLFARDGEVYDNQEWRQKLMETLKVERPDVIITHNPEDYNPDHNIVSRLALTASIFATLPHSSPSPALANLARILFMESVGGFGFSPEVYVDITETFEMKIRAIQAYQSQLRYMKKWPAISTDLVEMSMITSRLRGMQSGVVYAEAFAMPKLMGRVKAIDLPV